MRDPSNVFHLAIPCRDLKEAEEYYGNKLGQRIARRYNDRITLDFFGDQLVCHLAPEKIDPQPEMYPRHFGITFRKRADFDALLALAENAGLPFLKKPFVRFSGKREEHHSFFLTDPSNNVLEFKYYIESAMMY